MVNPERSTAIGKVLGSFLLKRVGMLGKSEFRNLGSLGSFLGSLLSWLPNYFSLISLIFFSMGTDCLVRVRGKGARFSWGFGFSFFRIAGQGGTPGMMPVVKTSYINVLS